MRKTVAAVVSVYHKMTSRSRQGARVETPHLAITYKPTDWPPATGPIPKQVKK